MLLNLSALLSNSRIATWISTYRAASIAYRTLIILVSKPDSLLMILIISLFNGCERTFASGNRSASAYNCKID